MASGLVAVSNQRGQGAEIGYFVDTHRLPRCGEKDKLASSITNLFIISYLD